MTRPPQSERPTVFLLHGLGLSGRAFDALVEEMGDDVEAVAIDLPGFGGTDLLPGVTVAEMAASVIDVVARRARGRWLLAGHSMGGKVATVVAAAALSGAAPVFGLAGVVLLAGSPPSPEPMEDQQRAQMLSWAEHGSLDGAAARAFVDGNVGASLAPTLDERALADVLRSSPAAWRAWLTRGSREDWTDQVGVLEVPALLLAGSDDPALGPDAQRRLNGPVYPRAEVRVLEGARHLLPLERPREVATAIVGFWRERAGLGPTLSADLVAVLGSARVSARTRAALAVRALADDPAYVPSSLDEVGLEVLRAVAQRVVPHPGPGSSRPSQVDLAARVDRQLTRGPGDGWRFDDLPPDVDAYRLGLAALEPILRMDQEEQDQFLARLAAGELHAEGSLSAGQLARWFEDARADLVREWVGHPATLGDLGYDGFATGGDGARLTGFELVGADQREQWEPTEHGDA